MQREFRDNISKILSAQPILFHSADFGHVHRARLYWGLDVAALKSSICVDVYPPGRLADIAVVRWRGSFSPKRFAPDDGFSVDHRGSGVNGLRLPGSNWTPTFPGGRFLAFTSCFDHPADRPPRSNSPGVDQRFRKDHKSRPLAHYARGNCVW
eukprot:1058730-Karenia_brevis.AAC.1